MAQSRHVAVLGPIPRDRIVTHRGETFEKYGCALYTTVALSALMGERDVIYPIVHVRREDEYAIKELFSDLPNVDLTGIRSMADQGDVVELTYLDQNTRIETQTGFMTPILPADVEFALDADAFVCVPITDYEVPHATLAYIRAHSKGKILLDGHGPTTTLVRGGKREHRLWVDRDVWLPEVDLLKMNLEEAGCSWFSVPRSPGAPETGAPIAPEELPAFAEHCLRQGVEAVCVTVDSAGCLAYTIDESGALQEYVIPRVPVDHVVDTTGCGDSFAAGMAFGYLDDADVVRACRYGNAMGAQRCAGSDLFIYLPLAETDEQIARAYGRDCT